MIDSKENHKCWRNFPHQKAEATSALTCLDLLLSRFLHLFLFLDVWQGKTQAITKDKKHKTLPYNCLENTAGWGFLICTVVSIVTSETCLFTSSVRILSSHWDLDLQPPCELYQLYLITLYQPSPASFSSLCPIALARGSHDPGQLWNCCIA